MTGNRTLLWFRVVGKLLRAWPFERGRDKLAGVLLNPGAWPHRIDIRFKYGTFLNTSVAPWPQGYRSLWIHGWADFAETRMWERLLKPGDTVIDGGANGGYWTLVASRAVGNSGHVIAIEPLLETAEALRRNVAASRVTNVTVCADALSDTNGQGVVHRFKGDEIGGQSSLRPAAGLDEYHCEEVRLTTLEDITRFINGSVSLLKLDIEGAELAALRGGVGLLDSKRAPFITYEYNTRTASAFGYHPREIEELLKQRGYKIFLLEGLRFRRFRVPEDDKSWIPMAWAFNLKAHAERLRVAGVDVQW